MKKVRIMLAGIAIFPVIGGALAFTAQKHNSTTLYSTNGGSDCNVKFVTFTTSSGGTLIDATLTAKTGSCDAQFRTTNGEQ